MRKVSMATRAELVTAISGRYVLGGRAEKARMLDEFVALTGFHRKHAMRLLRGDCEPAKNGPRPGRRVYGNMDSDTRRQLLAMSAATIDRVLKDIKVRAAGARRRKASTAIRRSVPVRTFSDWDDPAPGFVEADLVSHSGSYAKGAFSQTLVLTDIATGGTNARHCWFVTKRY